MDARSHFPFARLLTAAEQPRDRFWGIPTRALAFLLANVMFWQPLWAQAEGIVVVTPGVKLDHSANGVQVINIATPNGTGLSHNVFHDYNVGTQGLILNNGSTQTSHTQLGGHVIGNPNLTKSGSAQVILNEVIGGSPSQLKGYTEVAGQSARVIVANPYGITCSGCGFINTPQATLTTGKPVIGKGGRLERFQVDDGAVAIEGAGLNASNIDSVEIITRSAQINAQIHAKKLTIVAGRNDVDAKTLDAVARADDGSTKPQLAIDASALGGMYAGAIRLVGTEEGVGVKTAGDLVASAGDIQIDANGEVTTARISASGNLDIQAQDITLTDSAYAGGKANVQAQDKLTLEQDKSLAARDEVRLGGQHIVNQGSVQAGVNADGSSNIHGALEINGGELTNRGKIVATGALSTDLQSLDNTGAQIAAGQATIKAGSLTNLGGVLLSQQAMEITVEQALNNSDDGLILSKAGTLTVRAESLDNQSGTLQASKAGVDVTTTKALDNTLGKVIAGSGQLDLKAGELINQQGVLQAQEGPLKVTAASLDNRKGTVNGQQIVLALEGALNNDEGLVEAADSLQINAGSASNTKGQLRALGSDGKSQFTLGGLFNNDAGLVEINNASFALHSKGLSNQGGALRHAGDQGFDVSLADAGQAGGSFITNGALSLEVDDWTNTSVLQAKKLTLKVGKLIQTADGKLLSAESIEASGGSWVNDGHIETNGSLELILTGTYSGDGSLLSQGGMTISATSASFGEHAEVRSAGEGTYHLGTSLVNAGRITAANDLVLQVDNLTNTGTLGAGQQLSVESQTLLNQDGLIFSGADMLVHTDSLTNLRGTLYSLGSLDIAKDASQQRASLIENISGTLESADDMRLLADSLINRKEVFKTSLQQVSGSIRLMNTDDCKGEHCEADYRVVEVYGTQITEDSARANLVAGGYLSFSGESFDNQYSTVSAVNDLSITASNFWNTGAGGGEQRTSGYYVYTKDRNEYYGFVARIPTYNNYHNPDSASYKPTTMPLSSIRIGVRTGYSVVQTSGDVATQAVVQAGGDVSITGTQTLSNAVVRPGESITRSPDVKVDTDVSLTEKNVSHLNSQLPPDLAQQAVDPVNLPGFDLPQGTNGLFQVSNNPSHPYLVETNPRFADLKTFLSSDYLLNALGYEPDQSMRRLGDGLYEQRLIREAVVERTGKRFLEGLTSDEEMFRYLMDNSIASKDELNLSPGVGLTAEQVAALTHDIVWMEQREVNGQQVLVPVLYLAHANDRLAPNGALIQGQDVALITGGDLKNQGTLRADRDLQAVAGNAQNTGLMEANEHLSLLASQSIRNAMGGIIKGQDVSANALTGNLTNERTIGTTKGQNGIFKWSLSTADNAARIEAGNSLELNAGLNVQNVGGALQAGGDASVTAGGSLLIVSAEEKDSSSAVFKKSSSSYSRVTQHRSDVQVGGSLAATAGGDLSVLASTVKAGKNLELSAGGNVNVASAANELHTEYHSKRRGKKVDQQDDTVRQQSSVIEAGGDLYVDADKNLSITSSHLKSGGEAYLYAGEELSLKAAQDSDYHLYDYKKKGSLGNKKTRRDEVTDIKHIGSTITTGGDLTLVSEGNQLYQAAKLDSGNDITLDSGGSITFEAVKDLHQESHEKSKSSWAWTSAEGKGATDETLHQSRLIAKGDLVIQAVDGLKIDLKEVTQQSVSQTIDAMVKADPSFAWLKEMEQRNDVDWRRVKEVHDSFKYKHSSLGGPAAMIIAIVVTYLTWGAGSGLAGLAQGTWQAAVADTITSAVLSNAATSTINNRGDLGAVVEDVTSPEAIRGYIVAGITAGLTKGLFDGILKTNTDPLTKAIKVDLTSLEGIGRFAGNQILQNGTSTILDRALGGDSSLSSILRSSVASTFAAVGFNWVGDQTSPDKWDLKDGSVAKVGLHAIMGGLAAEAAGGDFKTGALAAGVNELLVDALAKQYSEMPKEERDRLLVMNSQVIGVLTATVQGGDPASLQTGAWVAANATSYNRLLHDEEKKSLTQEAEALEVQFGKPSSDLSWEEVLLLAASAQMDAVENARLQALLASYPPGSPELQHFEEDLLTATASIQRLASQNKVLTWSDKKAITANGSEVYAFQSTTEQFLDHGLFNTDSQWSQSGGNNWADDQSVIPDSWREQFGEKNAAIYLREIAGVSSSPAELDDLVQRVSIVLGGGVGNVTWDLDAALALTGAPAILRALLAKRLAAAGVDVTVAIEVPGRVQSRINLRAGDKKSGWEHVISRHYNSEVNASQFTIGQAELRTLLQSKEVVSSPVARTLDSADGIRYVREVNLGHSIGIDKFSGQPTSTMSILTDRFGNLITTTPGVIK